MILALLEAALLAPQAAPALEDLLQRARAAGAGPEAVLARGSARALGLDADYELLFDPASGAFAEQRGGALSEATYWSGSEGWTRDSTGAWMRLQFRDLEQALLRHWVGTGYWANPASGLEIELLQEDDGGEAVLRLRRPGARMGGVVRVVRATGLPSTLELASGSGPATWYFSNWRHGLPHTMSLTAEEELVRVELASSEAAPQYLRNPYEAVVHYPEDARWDERAAATLEVKKTRTGHLLVHPLVDGRDIGWFILDSGAGALVLDRGDVEELGSSSFGSVPAVGVGGTVSSSFHRAHSLQLGPLTIEAPLFVDLDLAFLDTAFGEDIGGIVGYDLLARAVVEVDFAQAGVSLHDPRRYTLPRGAWQEVFLDHRLPVVRGRIEGHEAILRLDTGADDHLTVLAPTVERLRLLEGREVSPTVLGGVGGMQPALKSTLREFELGGHRLHDLPARFAQSTQGAFIDSTTDGNVGAGVLGRFVLVFDYYHQRIAFLPRE